MFASHSKRALDWLEERYQVEGGGFHIAGWSANSAGVFEIVMAYPDRFLSVTGVAGMPGRGSEESLARLDGVRVQFIVGEHDKRFAASAAVFEKNLDVRTNLVIPDAGHGVHKKKGPEIASAIRDFLAAL